MSYTYNDSTYKDDGDSNVVTSAGITPGHTVFGVPEDILVVSGNWAVSNSFKAGASSKYVGERWIDLASTKRAPEYFVTDLYLNVNGKAVKNSLKNFDLRLTANNVLNERYIGGIVGGSGGWLGAPRTVAMTLSATF